jgi:MFS transporter, MCT family, solute carrier family 16 (monocarboxylic acid transporters), member 10
MSGPSARFPDSLILPLLAPGIQDIQEGLLFPILPIFARYRQLMVVIGVSIIVASTMVASYAGSAVSILLAQGVMFGVGGIILNFVHVSIFPEWFDKKQSQAMSIIWLGYRFGALGWPLICQALLQRIGFGSTLRVLVSAMIALLLPSVFLLRGRYPTSAVSSRPAKPGVSKIGLLRDPCTLFYLMCTLLFSTQMYIPLLFIMKIGADLGLDHIEQGIAQSLLTFALMLGTYATGAVSNEKFRPLLLALTAFSSAFSNLFFLGFCKSKAMLFTYALSIGMSSGGTWSTAWTVSFDAD